MSKINVLGLGYIGLPTAAVLAVRGHEVLGVDVSKHVIDTLNNGEIHIVEPGLDIIVSAAIKSGALKVSAIPGHADVHILAVPTPFKNDRMPDLSYIRSAAESIAPNITEGNLVILESTSPVGATKELSMWLADLRTDLRFPHQHGDKCNVHIAHCPERVLPGKVLEELVENDRIVGGISDACTKAAINLYETFVQGQCLPTTAATAEMAKLTENAFRDVNIAFANELSILAEEQGVDIWKLIELANHHPRVDILQPGPGVGGHCIAVDPWFLVAGSPNNARLIRQAREVNDAKPGYVIEKVKAAIADIPNPTVACLGLAFKPNIDDLRESPAVDICLQLAKLREVEICVVEPHIEQLPTSVSTHPNVTLCPAEEAIARANIILLLVDHSAFSELPTKVDLAEKIILDTRGQWRHL